FQSFSVCPVCGQNCGDLVYEGIGDPLRRKQLYCLRRCSGCRHVHTYPVPPPDTLSEYYPATYYAYVESTDGGFSSRVRRWLSREASDPLGRMSRSLLGNYIAILPARSRSGSLLDMGCGTGRFLSLMKDAGWNTYGTEISRKAVEIAKGNGHQVFW